MLALVLYGISFALMLCSVVVAWLAIKAIAVGEHVVINLIIAVVSLLIMGVGVLIGLVTPRVIRKLSGTDPPVPPY